MSANPLRVARIVLDSPLPQLDRLLDYRVPDVLANDVQVGRLVRVPLRAGGRQALGYVAELADASDYAGRLSDVTDVVSGVSVMPQRLYNFARAIADRQAGTLSDVLRLAIPRRYVRAEKQFLASSAAEPELPRPGRVDGLTMPMEASAHVAITVAVEQPRNAAGDVTSPWSLTMTQLAKTAISLASSAILAVPDFRDVAHVLGDLEAEGLGPWICRLDAEVEPAQRWMNYLRCVRGDTVIVVGSKSAVYAPVSKLGIIALWDDGDPLFDEQMAPYAHPRDVALIRHQMEGGNLAFLSRSPSAHISRLVDIGWLTHARVGSQRRPKVSVISEDDVSQRVAQVPPRAWQGAQKALEYGPVLIQVPRPGFANVTICSTCRQRANCVDCGGPLRRRTRGAVADCRLCGKLATTFTCPDCSGSQIIDASPGTMWTAEILGKSFPRIPVVVSDGERIITQIDGHPQLVVATPGAEPFCAGGYRVVIILNAERALMSERLRVVENALRVWSHTISACAPDGQVFVEGVGPRMAAVLTSGRFDDFMTREVRERSALHLPPSSRMAHVSGTAHAVSAALKKLPADAVYSILGPTAPTSPAGDVFHATVLFAFAHGQDVTHSLRASLLETASARRSKNAVPMLRVRIDDNHAPLHERVG